MPIRAVAKKVPTMRKTLLAAVISSFCASAAFAQTTPSTPAANPPAATKTIPKTQTTTKARTAESIECSKQAGANGLHGKERRKFRAVCKKQLMKKS
jgi:hypothetical protein